MVGIAMQAKAVIKKNVLFFISLKHFHKPTTKIIYINAWIKIFSIYICDMNTTKKRGRPAGPKNGEGNVGKIFREIQDIAHSKRWSMEYLCERAGVSLPTINNWRHKFPRDGEMFLALMSERSATPADLEASGIAIPPCIVTLEKIRGLV